MGLKSPDRVELLSSFVWCPDLLSHLYLLFILKAFVPLPWSTFNVPICNHYILSVSCLMVGNGFLS